MAVDLFPLFSGELHKPLDFFGVHLDLTLPTDTLARVTDGTFRLVAAGANHDDRFGIGPGVPVDIVPELGATLLFFALAMVGVVGTRFAVIRHL